MNVTFSELDYSTSVSLVSDGAEAVLINKHYFLQNLDDQMKRKLRSSVSSQSLPACSVHEPD